MQYQVVSRLKVPVINVADWLDKLWLCNTAHSLDTKMFHSSFILHAEPVCQVLGHKPFDCLNSAYWGVKQYSR